MIFALDFGPPGPERDPIKNIERGKATRSFRINKPIREMAKTKANQTHKSQKANSATHLESEGG